tara:strand:- start:2112 stop:3029 length:918 start_codon:yes stop_codon:yes gene_type:complete
MLNQESKKYLEERKVLKGEPIQSLTPVEARDQFNKNKDAFPLPEIEILKIENKEIFINGANINIRIFSDSMDDNLPLLINFHGGGWVLGDLDADDKMCRYLAKKSKHKVISVDYRLAPEYKFPIPLQDCYKAVSYINENHKDFNINPNKISICGTSAGGNLAAAVSMLFRDIKNDVIKNQILFTPVLNNDFETISYNEFSEGYGLEKETMIWFWKNYIEGDVSKANKFSAIIKDEINDNLPKTYIIAAECDVLKTESEDYHKNIKGKVDSRLEIYEGALHGFNVNIGNISDSKKCLDKVAKFLNS